MVTPMLNATETNGFIFFFGQDDWSGFSSSRIQTHSNADSRAQSLETLPPGTSSPEHQCVM